MTPSDEELVRRHLAGDRDAFPELLRRHELRVYNIALRMTGRPEDARDATQEAFLSVWRRLGSFRGDAKFSTWLHRIAVNAANDLLRKRSRTPVPAEETIEALAERPGSGDVAGDVAFEEDVRRALQEVPEEHRAVLVLHDVHDLDFDEIAAVLGIPSGTAKSRLHRGRLALARALGEPSARREASNP